MKYKVGQKVRVRPDIRQGMDVPFGVTSEMVGFAGKVVTIRTGHLSYDDNVCYTISKEEDPMGWSWSDKLFVPIAVSRDEAFNMLLAGDISDAEYEEVIQKEIDTHERNTKKKHEGCP